MLRTVKSHKICQFIPESCKDTFWLLSYLKIWVAVLLYSLSMLSLSPGLSCLQWIHLPSAVLKFIDGMLPSPAAPKVLNTILRQVTLQQKLERKSAELTSNIQSSTWWLLSSEFILFLVLVILSLLCLPVYLQLHFKVIIPSQITPINLRLLQSTSPDWSLPCTNDFM